MAYFKKYIKTVYGTVLLTILGFVIISLNSCYYDKSELLYPASACDTAMVKYSTSVLPVLSSNCIICHGGNTPSAGISLDSYTGVKRQVDNGRLWGAVSHSPNYSPMPKNSNKLNTCSLEKIRIWIAAGAPNN
jgi:hypothetical protein